MNNLRTIIIKELQHIWRDKRSMFVLFLLPAAVISILGFVISYETKNVSVAVYNPSKDPLAYEFTNKLVSTDVFRIERYLESSKEIATAFEDNSLQMIMVFPEDFSKQLQVDKTMKIQFMIDATNTVVSSNVSIYTKEIMQDFVDEHFPSSSKHTFAEPIIRYMYNPALQQKYMSIPGLFMIIFIIISSVMVSIAVSKEKENGTYRLLVLTPISTGTTIFGKIIPYLIISIGHIFSVWFLCAVLFHIPVLGSRFAFFLLCLSFALNAMAFGVMVATLVNRQLEALIICWLVMFIPNIFLSGYISPIRNIPDWLQVVARLMPGESLMSGFRNIAFKGGGFEENYRQFTVLLSETFVMVLISMKCLKTRFIKR